jgi:hypothetical protein
MGEEALDEGAKRRLRNQLDELLEQSIGLNVFPKLPRRFSSSLRLRLPTNPLTGGLAMAGLYLLLFVAIPWALARPDDRGWSLRIMLLFQVYGALWSGWATATTRITSQSVVSVLVVDVLPRLSTNATERVTSELDRLVSTPRRQLGTAWAIGIGAGILAVWLLHQDLPELSWWMLASFAAGWVLLYATAAKVVSVSRFYGAFGAALVHEPESLHALSPSKSPLVSSLGDVSKRMLFFWFGITVSIVLILPFNVYAIEMHGMLSGSAKSSLDLRPLNLPNLHAFRFVLAHLVITALFSIVLGTIVFLRSEAALRRAVRSAANIQLHRLQQSARAIITESPHKSLDQESVQRLSELNALYAEVVAGGSYRTIIIGGASVLLPFVPLIALLLNQLT